MSATDTGITPVALVHRDRPRKVSTASLPLPNPLHQLHEITRPHRQRCADGQTSCVEKHPLHAHSSRAGDAWGADVTAGGKGRFAISIASVRGTPSVCKRDDAARSAKPF